MICASDERPIPEADVAELVINKLNSAAVDPASAIFIELAVVANPVVNDDVAT